MWIIMNDSFVSIVTEPTDYTKVQVRARRAKDLVDLFKGFCERNPQIDFTRLMEDMEHTPDRDYQYRIRMHRDAIASVIEDRVRNIYYNNFKDSVEDFDRVTAYSKVWADLYGLDEPKRSFMGQIKNRKPERKPGFIAGEGN